MNKEKNDIEKEEVKESEVVDSGYWSLFRLMGLLAFITVLVIPYIYNAHRSEKKIRYKEKLNTQNEELRSEYITLKSEVIGQNKQSDVAKKLKTRNIKELSEAPIDLNTKHKE